MVLYFSADFQLAVALYVLFLYNDDRSRFKHNKIPHKMTCGLVFAQGGRLIEVKIPKKDT